MTSKSEEKEYKTELNRSTILASVCKRASRSPDFYKSWSTESLLQRLEGFDDSDIRYVLLTNDQSLRYYQIEAIINIINQRKCLVKMFCGTGKSRIFTNDILYHQKKLNIIVFPSLALINQYSSDYYEYFNDYNIINISSEILPTIKSTTNTSTIKTFLNQKNHKLVLVTYQSFDVLLNCIETKNFGSVYYDEAHHVVSPEYRKLVFSSNYFEREIFLTATPRNENGITMLDLNHPENNMCGELAYDYTYLQGFNSKVLNEFEICVDMYTENTNNNLYEAMARAILKRNTSRVLSFHSGVNGESNTDVKKFVNLKAFKKSFDKIQKEEFPEKSGYYTKITFKGIDGQTPSTDRKKMLSALDNTPDTEIYIISSCETIGEGVDTKKANMCVFADPKSSVTKIIQNIGRVVRRNNDHPMSTVLIPCFVDMNNYTEVLGDAEKQDEIIRKQMRMPNGDYAPILNVLGALKQEDPDIYDMCLNYPNRKHKKDSLKKQGFKIEESKVMYSVQEVQEMKDSGETPLEIHTNETIERFNETPDDEEKNILRLYQDDEDGLYKPIVRCKKSNTSDSESQKSEESNESQTYDESEESDSSQTLEESVNNQVIQPPKPRKKGVSMSIHQNEEITMLWSVKGELDFSKRFFSTVIECNVSYGIEKWRMTLKKVIDYMEKEKKRPSEYDKKPHIKILGNWVTNQKTNYKNYRRIMTNPEIRKEWEDTVDKYKEYLVVDNEEVWKITLKKVVDYIEKEKKRPSKEDKDKNIKQLGAWISTQKSNYTENKQIMCNPEIRKEWEDTVDKYKEYLVVDNKEVWRITLKKVIDYMDKEKKSPSQHSKDKDIKKLGNWVTSQKSNYTENKQIMCNPEIRKEWKDTVDKYKEYLSDREELWKITLKKVIYYMDTEKKSPSKHSKDKNIKQLGEWICHQKKNYKDNKFVMSIMEIRKEWEDTIDKYKEYMSDREELWKITLKKVIDYMEKEKLPSSTSKIGKWISTQKGNYLKNKCIMTNPEIRKEWEETLVKYKKYLNQSVIDISNSEEKQVEILTQLPYCKDSEDDKKQLQKTITKKQKDIPKVSKESNELKESNSSESPPLRSQSEIGKLHRTYHRIKSEKLHQKFKDDPQLWEDYHETRKQNFASYEKESIPTNRIIKELKKIKTKRHKVVVDMGCGKADIAHYFKKKKDNRFLFYNYDHQSGGDEMIKEVDISELPLEDASVEIAIMSLALWGTKEDKLQYIREAYRVLESGGKFYISDSTKKWSPKLTKENGGEKLRNLLTENGFKIISEEVGDPFCLFVCSKEY
jgi:superfamily II DNA or RNA helicase